LAVRKKKPTSENIREIVESLGILTDEDARFERLTATKDVLSLVYGNAEVYERAVNMLTGNNRLVFEAGREANVDKRYRIVLQKLCELNELQFSVTANLFPPLQYYLLLKDRCELCNDNAACLVLDSIVKGEPGADDEISRLGLLGLWQIEDNRQAGAILVALGTITEEEFKRAVEEREAAVKPTEIMHGCAICGGLFPESKCVKARYNQSEEWICITDFERLEAEGKAIPVKRFVPGIEVPPAAPPAIPAGFEEIISGMKARGEEWGDVLTYIDKTYGYDEKLIGKATEIYYKPTPETTSSPGLEDMKHTIKDRMDKLKTEEPEPFVVKEDAVGKRTGRLDLLPKCRVCDDVECAGIGGEDWFKQVCKKETLIVKEEIRIPPSDLTLMYMEPTDYESWAYWDFEGIIPGLEFEDLQELYDYVGLSEKMTDQEIEDIRALISKRINEIRVEGS